MREKLKQFWRVAVLATVVLLAGCAKEEYQDEQVRINQRMVNLNDLPMLQQAIEAKRSKLRQTNKSLTDYLGMIVPDKIKLIEKDGTKYYTCALSMVEYEKLTNLVITEKDNIYDYKLVEYTSVNYDQWKEDIKEDGFSSISPFINVAPIDNKFEITGSGLGCVTFSMICPEGIHSGSSYDPACTHNETEWLMQLSVDADCLNGGGNIDDIDDGFENQGSSSSSTNTTTPHTGGSTTQATPTPTPPVVTPTGPQQILTTPQLTEDMDYTPCDSFKKLTNPNGAYNIGPKLTQLQNSFQYNVNNGEDGVSFQMGTNEIPQNIDLETSIYNTISMPHGPKIYGGAHTHPDKLYNMFSFSDIYELYLYYNTAAAVYKNDAVFMLVNEDGTVYAIKVENIEALGDFLVEWVQKEEFSNTDFGRERTDAVNNTFFNGVRSNSGVGNNLELGFLEMVQSAGISLYRSNDGNHQTWKKLEKPTDNSGIIKETSCN